MNVGRTVSAQRMVGVGQMEVSASKDDVLTTYSLSSCLGLSLYDPEAVTGGMIHCMLPLSRIDPDKAQANPHMFTDLGVPALLQALFHLGARRERLVAKAAGCGRRLDERDFFRIGERNYAVLRKVLWRNEILIAAEDVGGAWSRTLRLEMATGRTLVTIDGKAKEL